ncbi:MAG: M28 family peptidase [Candidatus Sericytochromatia bacterium]|nr:M28 family peptidase [Candidatus Sericytochromatia bacterium]
MRSLAIALVLWGVWLGSVASPSPEFQGERALMLARRLVAFGPRVPGTAAHRQAAAWLKEEIVRRGGRLEVRRFTGTLQDRPVSCVNLIGRTGPPGPAVVVLMAHWDTRPWCDRDPEPAARQRPGPGANDGASGVAVLLELLPLLPRDLSVATVLVDGEDLGQSPETYAQGSRAIAPSLARERPRWALVLDMVGRKDVRFLREGASLKSAPWLLERLETAAVREGASHHFTGRAGAEMFDDHTPLIAAGIPAVDLIDMEDPAWHTHADGYDRLSPATLEAVGRTVARLLRGESAPQGGVPSP